MAHSTKTPRQRKSRSKPQPATKHQWQKPYDGFELTVHPAGYFCKKHRGKTHYFGRVAEGWEKALEQYRRHWPEILQGRTPTPRSDRLSVRELCNLFCAAKEHQRDAGDITPRSFNDYVDTAKLVAGAFGRERPVSELRADDFEKLRASLAKRRNPNTLGNVVQRIRTLFKYGYDACLLDNPVRFGPTFKRPAKRILRKQRQQKGPRTIEAREIRRLLKAASQPMRAIILLGINCGFGNSDCGTLPLSALDFTAGWITYPRPKTSVERRCPLWPETVAALREAIAKRPKHERDETKRLAFVTRKGQPWSKDTADSPVSKEFRKLLDKLELYRPGVSFYTLRHMFETIGGRCKDQVAVNFIMGHADGSMAAVYRERIEDERLLAASNAVREWLFRRTSSDLWGSKRERKSQ